MSSQPNLPDGDYWTKTIKAFEGVIDKPPVTEKYLKRPPFRFIQLVFLSIVKSTGFGKGLFSSDEMTKKDLNADEKLDYVTKLVTIVGLSLRKRVPVYPKKILAGLEPDKTNRFLQMLAYAVRNKDKLPTPLDKCLAMIKSGKHMDVTANGMKKKDESKESKPEERKTPFADSKKKNDQDESKNTEEERKKEERKKEEERKREAEARKRKEEEQREEQRKEEQRREEQRREEQRREEQRREEQRKEEQRKEEQRKEEQRKEQQRKEQQRQQERQKNEMQGRPQANEPDEYNNSQEKLKEARTDIEDERIRNQTRRNRPSSARPPPPTNKTNVKEARDIEVEEKPDVDSGVILDQDAEEEEDTIIIEDSTPSKSEMKSEGGALIERLKEKAQIGEQKNQQPKISKKQSKGLILRQTGGGQRNKEDVQNELSRLRKDIQVVCASTNPLGKTMDYIQEDIDSMKRELTTWQKASKKYALELADEKKKTSDILKTHNNNISEVERKIEEKIEKIHALKAQILQQDEEITKFVAYSF